MAGTPGRSGGNRKGELDAFPADGAPSMPDNKSIAFKRHWKFMLAHLPSAALRKVDQIQLAILAEQLVEIEQLSEMISADPTDLKARSLRLRVAQQVSRLSAQFGLSPSDRMRLKLEPQGEEDDVFGQLLAKMGKG